MTSKTSGPGGVVTIRFADHPTALPVQNTTRELRRRLGVLEQQSAVLVARLSRGQLSLGTRQLLAARLLQADMAIQTIRSLIVKLH
jgi:hypothetical protein